MDTKRFTKNDAGFVCAHCGYAASPLGYTSRNHCPRCLYSLHVDEHPGDRACACGGQMRPEVVVPDARKGFIITHRCLSCGARKRNRAQQDDDRALLIRLTNPYNQEQE